MLILIGRKTNHVKSPFTVLYAGHDGTELMAAAVANADKGFARLEKITNPMAIPVRVDLHLASVKDAEERAQKERAEAEEAKRQAELLQTEEAKAKAEKEEAEAAAAEKAAADAKAAAKKSKAK